MTDPIKMLPCPFCEGPPCEMVENEHPHYGQAERLDDYGDDGKYVSAYVFCHECGAQGESEEDFIFTGEGYDEMERRACERWNRRDNRNRNLYDGGEEKGLNFHPRPVTQQGGET